MVTSLTHVSEFHIFISISTVLTRVNSSDYRN